MTLPRPKRTLARFCIAAGLLCTAPALHGQVSSPELFLLSAASAGGPAVLYRLGPNHTLVAARVIGADANGRLQVVSSEQAIFVVHAGGAGSAAVSIVHKARPLEADEVSVPLAGSLSPPEMIAARETSAGSTKLLMPVSGGAPGASASLFAVDASAAAQPRLAEADRTAFSVVEYRGRPASQVPEGGVRVWDQGDTLTLADHANVVCDAQVPKSLQLSRQKGGPPYTTMVASSERYALFVAEPDVAVPPRADTTLYVHDRHGNKWGELRVDGSNNSSMRLFGSWLAVRVEIATGVTGTQSSAVGSTGKHQPSTDHLPNFPQSYFPGYVLLHNLETGRDIRIKTGIADTEVEQIEAGTVIYRVGQRLLRGHLEGNTVNHPEELVNDPAVVNVHWIFSAPAAS